MKSNIVSGTWDVTVFAMGGQKPLFPVRSYKVIGSKVYAADRAQRDYREEHSVAPQLQLGVHMEPAPVMIGTTLPPMPQVKAKKKGPRKGGVSSRRRTRH